METLLIGLLWILFEVLVAALIVYVIIWVLGMIGFALPVVVVKLLWALVALFALILLVQLLFGVMGHPFRLGRATLGALPAIAPVHLSRLLT